MAARILVAIALMLSLFERDRRENVAITSRHDKSRSRSRPRQARWIQANYAGALSLDGMSDKQIIAAPQEPQSHKALLRLARQSAYSADVYSNLEAFFYTRVPQRCESDIHRGEATRTKRKSLRLKVARELVARLARGLRVPSLAGWHSLRILRGSRLLSFFT
jgi:hypothetical protein